MKKPWIGKRLSYRTIMPAPTRENPKIQVDWIFREKALTYETKSSQENYRSACSFYKRYLDQTNNYNPKLAENPLFWIRDEWDVLALAKVKQWIDATNIPGQPHYLTSGTISNILGAIRLTMAYAFEHRHIDRPVMNIPIEEPVRETNVRTAFSITEYERIFSVLAPMIQLSKGLLKPYKRTGLGVDPRILRRSGSGTSVGKPLFGQGWSCPQLDSNGQKINTDNNMRWYFENEMNCVPLRGVPEYRKRHKNFFLCATNYHGGLNNLYRKWGVSWLVDQNVIMPLVVELIAETGLNVESVLSLRRDCFKEAHPLTGLPYLDYIKLRSGGEKELHLALYDKDGEQATMGLNQKQSRVIAQSINDILKLTEPLVENAPADCKDYLLIYQTDKRNRFGEVKRVNLKTIGNWTNRIVGKHDLVDDNGERLVFALSRFRPTKITEMVIKGYDFFDIMSVAGHCSVMTTLQYLDKLQATTDFHRTMYRTLNTINKNLKEYKRKPLPIAQTQDANPGKFIFKGPVCDCKNPYDPPDVVRRSEGFKEGMACHFWNMCLTCPNVLITEANTPKLFAYRREIEGALANVGEIPRQGELYKAIKMILDEILTPDTVFSKKTIHWAASVAQQADFEVLDSFINHATEYV